MQDTAGQNQPTYSEYEPPVNRKHARMADELQEARKPVSNFNPTYEPSGGDYQPAYEQPVRDSRDMDVRRRKNDYRDDLMNQMKQKEMQKQNEKNEARTSVQGMGGSNK